MTTTTIRLPEELKAQVTAAAARSGTTAHAFILEAIAEKTANEERRAEFDTQAEERYAQVVASGMTIPWRDMRAYLRERVVGKPGKQPVARKLAR
jgi:predicted transcriptional regulator